MTDTPDIKPIYIDANQKKLIDEIRYLTGEEIDLLDAEGIRFDSDVYSMRLAIGVGWLQLRRSHPNLSYKDGRKLVRIDLAGIGDDEGDDEEAPQPVDPPDAGA